MQLITATTVS